MEKKVARHLLFWIAYLAFEIYTEFLWFLSQHPQLQLKECFYYAAQAETLVAVVIKLPLVYLSFCLLNRYTVLFPNKFKLVLSLSAALVVFSILAHVLDVYITIPYICKNLVTIDFFGYQWLINSFMDKIFIVGVAIALKQYSATQKLRIREQLLIKETLVTELNFLKSQINPHFLFNTLNNIYALARKKSDDTADVVLRLSKLLRFVLYEARHQKISISREVQFLHDYIELEKIRYNKRLRISFVEDTDAPDTAILPLILVPFVENAFKHGASESTSEIIIKIDLSLKNGMLIFNVENTFEPESQKGIIEGIGLRNLRRQLELTYPDFNLRTITLGNNFIATLTLDTNSHEN